MIRLVGRLAVPALGVVGLAGCGLLFQESEPARAPSGDPAAADPRPDPWVQEGDAADLPGGFGTLRQEDISIRLRRGDLEILVTPLDESVTRTTAPDTWERLSALARTHREVLRDRTGADAVRLFLVALHSETQAVSFRADDLSVVSRGLRFRPLEIHGLSPGWDRGQVAPRETLMALYVFPLEVDLGRVVELEYQEVRSRDWERILPVVEAERARVRARTPF